MPVPGRGPWLVGLVILLAGVSARAAAQAGIDDDLLDEKISRSHLIDPSRFGLPEGSAEELFLQRLKSIHTKEIGEGLGKQLRPDVLDTLRQNQDAVKTFLKEFKITQLPEDLRKKFAGRESEIEELIQSMDAEQFLKYAQEAQGIHPAPAAGAGQSGSSSGTPSNPSVPSPSQDSGALSQAESKTQETSPSDGSSGDQPAKSVVGRWLLEAANHFKDLDPALRNSPALRKIVHELSQKMDGADDRWKQLDDGANAVAERFARLGQVLPLSRLVPEQGISWPRSLTGQSWSHLHWPESGPRVGRLGSPSLPQAGMPDLTGEAGWRAVGMVGLLTIVVLVLWKTFGHNPARADGARDAWKLGPWPIHPTAVKTRAELIQAFEYLSLLRLGPTARNWHHWAIASGLGRSSDAAPSPRSWADDSSERLRAAEQLAFLYEQARYAPAAEALPEAALATARRDLCLLAGVPLA
ncbi:MAG TPA: hypothetical protein VKU02_34135 [Gemmataceae bacterium]|nr:hypothetical protein [Gemmataceae bacterium]